MKSLNTKLDGWFCSDNICEGNWICQYWKPNRNGEAMIRCIANYNKGIWTKLTNWHDDDIKVLKLNIPVKGVVCFMNMPVKDFNSKERCF